MTFVYPEFLFALAALSIPVIIHLFNFRRFRKVFFTNVRFIQEIKKDTDSKAKLKHLLVLLARLLAIAFIVLAFARPFLPGQQAASNGLSKPVSLFIDNSFSMESVGKNGPLLEDAKQKAKEIIGAYNNDTRFQILSGDFEARHQRLYTKTDALQMLDQIQPSPAMRKLSEIVARQNDALQSSKENGGTTYILSDFQQSMIDMDAVHADSTVKIRFVPFIAKQNKNIAIDSCYFTSPVMQAGKSMELVVIVKNYSEEKAEEIPVKLFINGQQKALSSASIEANSKVELKLSFTPADTGFHNAYVNITDYPVVFDDTYYFSFHLASNAPLLHLYADTASRFIRGVYASEPYFDLHSVKSDQIDFSTLPNQRMLILDALPSISSGMRDELIKYLKAGGSIALFPKLNDDYSSLNQLLSAAGANSIEGVDASATRIDKLNTESPLLNDVFEKIPENLDLPTVSKHVRFSHKTGSGEETLMRLLNGDPFLSHYTVEKGHLYVFAAPLSTEASNFPKHALFVPVMYKMAFLSDREQQLAMTIGQDDVLALNEANVFAEMALHVKNQDGAFDVVPELRTSNGTPRLLLHGQIKESGNYVVYASQAIAALGFNYDRRESVRACLPPDELLASANRAGLKNSALLESDAADFSASVKTTESGTQLWKYCVLLALLFLAIEVLLIRLFNSFAHPKTIKPL